MPQEKPEPQRADPRLSSDPRTSNDSRASTDPRLSGLPRQRSRQSSSESQHKPEKISIYEQGSIDRNAQEEDPDIDLRSKYIRVPGLNRKTNYFLVYLYLFFIKSSLNFDIRLFVGGCDN